MLIMLSNLEYYIYLAKPGKTGLIKITSMSVD